jgi:hypothetical protein
MDREQRRYHAEKQMIDAQEFADLVAELLADRAREQQSTFLDQAANLVLDVSAHGH